MLNHACAFQQQQQQIQTQRAQNDALLQENKEIKERLAKLEALVLNNSTNSLNLNSASLEQNTPNPVNGSTALRYHLPEHFKSATLTITDAKGQLVKTMLLTGSTGQVNLDTLLLAAGTYNYSLIVDGKQADTKRLVVVH